ncbi:MAG: isoprenyl transferase [Deltaproteobacteria bacterium]|nr:isoprenyl transferase [Deltaproteobacteria bacterium]
MNEEKLLSQIDKNNLPTHIAIIMDGNGRWAETQKKARIYGHMKGIKTTETIVKTARNIGIPILTIFAFSTENWQRPKEEVNFLLELISQNVRRYLPDLMKNKIRFRVMGKIEELPKRLINALENAQKKTEKYDEMILNVAINYGGKWDILNATRNIAKQVRNGRMSIKDIDEKTFSLNLNTSPLPDPDLLIRTGKEKRISNFLLWQLSYTELYFSPKMWPNFSAADFYRAIINFQHRKRRFGRI